MTPLANHEGRRAGRAPARWVEGLAVLYVCFVLQATLVPFDFGHPVGADTAFADVATLTGTGRVSSRHFFVVTAGASYWPDTVGNVFLYLPLGFLLHWSFSRGERVRSPAAASILVAGVLSFATEWVQAYSPSRVSSLVDVLANVGGATLGSVSSWVGCWNVPRLLGELFREYGERPRQSLLLVYGLGLAFFETMPFAPMLDRTQLATAWKTATVVPFAEDAALAERARAAAERGDWDGLARQRLARMSLWARWCAEAAAFAVLAWLVQAALRDEYHFGRGGAHALAWWMGGGLALMFSLLQFPLRGRGFHGTDVLMRWLGVSVGLFVRSAWVERASRSTGAAKGSTGASATCGGLSPGRRRWLARGALAAVAAYVAITGVMPFMLDTREGLLRRALVSPDFAPFMAYFTARFDVAMDDLMTKLASFGLLAALLAQCWTRFDGRRLRHRLAAVASAVVTLSLSIESAQIFIRGRTPSLTDPVIAAIASWLGVVAHHRLARFFSLAATSGASPPSRPGPPGWTLTDELVAELMDERSHAPKEKKAGPAAKAKR